MAEKTMDQINAFYLTWTCNPPRNPNLAKLVNLLDVVEAAANNDPLKAACDTITTDMGGAPDIKAIPVLKKIFPKNHLDDKSTNLSSIEILRYISVVEDMCQHPLAGLDTKPPNPWQ